MVSPNALEIPLRLACHYILDFYNLLFQIKEYFQIPKANIYVLLHQKTTVEPCVSLAATCLCETCDSPMSRMSAFCILFLYLNNSCYNNQLSKNLEQNTGTHSNSWHNIYIFLKEIYTLYHSNA